MNANAPIVTFVGLGISATAHRDETVLDVARRTGAPLGNSCGGVGICARCRVTVCGGEGNLSEPTSVEVKFGTARKFAADERMACQAVVRGDCAVTTTYW